MNTFRVGIFLCCAAAIFANGCNPIDPCAGVTCDPNEVCINGACVACDGEEDCDDQNACTNDTCVDQACSTSPFPCDSVADCPAGCNAQCLRLDGICFSGFECESGADCDPNEVCIYGDCVECESDADCDGGEFCDEATNTCVECVGDADCNDNNACTFDNCIGQNCSLMVIFCDSDEDCPAGCGACNQSSICTN